MSNNPNSYISVDKSLKILLKNIKLSRKTDLVSVFEALGRILEDDIISTRNVPSYNTSHMDGFAIRSEDTACASPGTPVFLKVSNHKTSLGTSSNYPFHDKGEAHRIHTGGHIPSGSDTVVPVEDVVILDDKSEIKITKFLKKGSFVYLAGSDIKKDKKVMNKGQVIRAQHIGLLATLQISTVTVYQKPIISIIPTGSELTDDIEEAKNNNNNNNQQTKVVNTNSHIISCLIRELGGSPIDMGITPDSIDILREKIMKGLRISDLVLTIGGTSAGEHDIVKSTINQIGSPGMIANKVKLDRGRVAGIAAIGQKPIIVLPGPVQGALNAFIVFARPLMSLLSGRNDVNNFTLSAMLDQDWVARKKFHTFRKILYVKLSKIKPENNFIAKPIIGETQSISLLSEANAFVVIPEEVSELYKGDIVEVNLLPGFSYMHDFQVID